MAITYIDVMPEVILDDQGALIIAYSGGEQTHFRMPTSLWIRYIEIEHAKVRAFQKERGELGKIVPLGRGAKH